MYLHIYGENASQDARCIGDGEDKMRERIEPVEEMRACSKNYQNTRTEK